VQLGVEVPWLLHQAGINLRYLGKLYSELDGAPAKMLLLMEVCEKERGDVGEGERESREGKGERGGERERGSAEKGEGRGEGRGRGEEAQARRWGEGIGKRNPVSFFSRSPLGV
jgi:hypothetical protein